MKLSLIISIGLLMVQLTSFGQKENMIFRIAEIEIDSAYINEYKSILKEQAAVAVKNEPGVISIFPMYQMDNPYQIRILEIYADRRSYEEHLKTTHFVEYKTTTLKMVKSLKLVEMQAVDVSLMKEIFLKKPTGK